MRLGWTCVHVGIVNLILTTPNIRPGLIWEEVQPIDSAKLKEINIVELARSVADRGDRVTLYVADAYLPDGDVQLGDRLVIRGVSTRLRRLFHPAIVPLNPTLPRSIEEDGPDVIQSGEFHQPGTFLASRAAAATVVPLLVWQEAFRPMRVPGRWYQQFFELTAGRSVRAMTTRFVLRTTKARAYLESIGVPASVIGPWIPTGINGDSFQTRSGSLHPEDLGLPIDCALVAMAGRLNRDKGMDLAIRSVAVLKKMGIHIALLIAGVGPELEPLRALAKHEEIDDVVRLLGHRSRTEMANLYHSADLFLLTSRNDTLPFSLIEAGCCGLASVTVAVGCVEDIVQDGVTGIVVASNSVESIATGIARLLADDGLREAMGKAARQRFVEHFDLRVTASRLARVYEEAVDRGTGSNPVGGGRRR